MHKWLKKINRIYLFHLILPLIFFLVSITSSAQSNQVYNNIKVKDGLPSNFINAVSQDSTGFMWFGTNSGLVRYDGYEVVAFRNDRTTKIDFSKGNIGAIENGSNNGLWAGSTSGLLYFDTSTGENRKIELGGDRNIRCILKQGDSILWVGSNDGLFKVTISDGSFKLYNEQNSKLSSNIIRSLFLSNSNELWIGTFNGLNQLREDEIVKTYNLKNNYKPALENNLILDIEAYSKTSDSLLWVGTETGLVLFNTKNETYDIFNTQNTNIINEVVKCVYSKIPGEVYFGTDLGFYKYNVQTKEVNNSFHDPFNQYSIANNVVSDIFEDKNGMLWLATGNGISKLNLSQNKFQFTPVYSQYNNKIVGTQVNKIYKDKNGAVWLATTQGVKVLHSDGGKEVFSTESSPNRRIVLNTVSTISGDKLGRIWIGTAGGINIWDPTIEKMYTITATFTENTGLRTNYIASFITPDDGSIWVTTWGGGIYKAQGDLSNVDAITFRFIADLNSGVISANKKIWIYENQKMFALNIITNEVETFENLNARIRDKGFSSIHVSKRGELWMGSNNMLIKYQVSSGEVHEFSINTGNSSMLDNLIEDHSGNIWGTSLTSIFKFDVSENIFETYPKNEGIALDNFIPYSKTLAEDGQIFFGGNDGFISFYADDIKKSDFQPNLLITNLSVGGEDIYSLNEIGSENKTTKQISFFDNIILEHNQNSFQLQFSSLDLAEPERNIYAYKLEGFDKDWIYTTGDRNYASYTNLSRGDYTFKVKSTNNDGVWLADETILNVLIKPPLWASPLAIIFYSLILIVAILLLKREYRNKIKWEEEVKLIKVEKEKNEEIALSKQRLFTNISHDFLTPLNLIIGPVETMIKNNRFSQSDSLLLTLIQKNAKRVHSLINQLLDIRKIETNTLRLKLGRFDVIDLCQKQYDSFQEMAERKLINYKFEATHKSFIFEGDKMRLESIIQNLLSNAFKFTQSNGSIKFKIEAQTQSSIKISISDNGIGIPNEKQKHLFKRFHHDLSDSNNMAGNGIGLNIAKEYCELMNGKIWYNSELNKGSTFYVELPFQWIDAKEGIIEMTSENILPETEILENIVNFKNKELPILLLVDDDADTLKYLEFSLKDNYIILKATNGQQALNILEKNKVNIIISDVMMDEMDGVEFCKKVKQQPKHQNIPIVLLTARTTDSQKAEGYQAGADAYLNKPFNLEILKIRLKNLISKKQKIDSHIKKQLILGNQEVEVQSADEKLLQETIQYINKHITNTDINLEDMAHSIGVSYSSLYRKIKAQTGLKLNELVRDIRLKKAEYLIKNGKLTISEIIYETGFSSHSYFAKCFKKEYGVAPNKYHQSKK